MKRLTGNVYNQIRGKGRKNSDKRRMLAMLEAEIDFEDTQKIKQHGSDNTKKASDSESHNWADAAIASMEENFLTISSAIVHVYGQWNSEMASGQFSILRQTDGRTEPAMVLKVGRNLHWAITKDLIVCKLDKLRYLFSIVLPATVQAVEDDMFLLRNHIPSSEVLNYVVSFPKEEEDSSSLRYLESYLKQHARFNGPSSLDKKSRFKSRR